MVLAPQRAASDDRDILRLLQAGAQERAFGLVLDRYEGKVFRLCCAMLRDYTLAQGIAQESWLRIWRALDSFDGRASLSTWIYTIARNRCRTAAERRRAQFNLRDLDGVPPDDLPRVEPKTEDRFAALRALVNQLPERYRLVLTLYYYEEQSVGEVAALLAIPEGTVKVTLHRARTALRDLLRERALDDVRQWLEEFP
jgi:RNA polymerase sigma-70 factor (ECF subfamily)